MMAASIVHRGPDEGGTWLSDDVGLAFRRLSIIDVQGGNQPIFNEDGSAAIILNGEIYNYRELRAGLLQRGHRFRTRSDVETVLHLWEEKGQECLDDLRGMFALAIWNSRDHSLFLARDRVGKKPLYFCRLANGSLVFGSEIKALLQHPAVCRKPDLDAISQYLILGYVPSPTTAFQGIERLPAAHSLRWRNGSVAIERYWSLDYEPKMRQPEAELREELLRLLREAVSIRLESEVPLGAFLSGGVDSSVVVAFAADLSPRPLKTFSVAFQPSRFDESRYSRMVAERYGTDHHELLVTGGAPELIEDIIWHYDQPFGDSSAVPSFHIARVTRPHVTVVLNGDGGDESFAGYDRYRLSRYQAYFLLPEPLRRGIQTAARPFANNLGRGKRLLRGPIRDPFDAYFATLVHLNPAQSPWLFTTEFLSHVSVGTWPPLTHLREMKHPSLLDSMLHADVNNYLADDLLVKMDVATMAHSLEARSPLLDHKLMEFMAMVPDHLKLRGGESKHLLKSAVRGLLPREILDRKKMGFGVPLGSWLRDSLKDMLIDTILSPRAISRGMFHQSAVNSMIRAQMAGDDRFQYVLWDLLLLELWHRRFIDQVPVPSQA
jgi:asparagine synthase (glutamine-hydrolysing)